MRYISLDSKTESSRISPGRKPKSSTKETPDSEAESSTEETLDNEPESSRRNLGRKPQPSMLDPDAGESRGGIIGMRIVAEDMRRVP